jgi:hypothetical protein
MLVIALDEDLDDGARIEALGRRGFDDPARPSPRYSGSGGCWARRGSRKVPGPRRSRCTCCRELARSPDPDQALFYLADFASALSVPAGYLRLLESRPRWRGGSSTSSDRARILSAELVRTPELLDQLVSWDAEALHKPPERIRSEL